MLVRNYAKKTNDKMNKPEVNRYFSSFDSPVLPSPADHDARREARGEENVEPPGLLCGAARSVHDEKEGSGGHSNPPTNPPALPARPVKTI